MVYVIMTDTFLTNWGPAEGKKAVIIFECETLRDAKIIAANARFRRDRSEIKIRWIRPRFKKDKYHIEIRGKNQRGWYNEGGPDMEEKPQAVLYISGELGLDLIKIEYGINDYAIVKFSDEKRKRKVKIDDRDYIKVNGKRYHMDEFIKC